MVQTAQSDFLQNLKFKNKVTIFYLVLFFAINTNYSIAQECPSLVELDFIRIPSGELLMGTGKVNSGEISYEDEKPQHRVLVNSFCITKNRISLDDTARIKKNNKNRGLDNAIEIWENEPEFTWESTKKLLDLLSKISGKIARLPTEEEWEWAVRGGLVDKRYPWGNITDTFNGYPVSQIIVWQLSGQSDQCPIDKMPNQYVNKDGFKKCFDMYDIERSECLKKFFGTKIENLPNSYGLNGLMDPQWEWTSTNYESYQNKFSQQRKVNSSKFRVLRGGKVAEGCSSYNALRGYGSISDSYYSIRIIIE